MADYATAQQIQSFAQQGGALTDPQSWGLLATSASRLFDKLAEVEDSFFAASSGESDKVLYGDGTAYLRLPPYTLLGVDPIVILDSDDNELEIPEYFEQGGYLVIRDAGLRRRTGIDTFTGWPINQEITVSAAWGFAEIPADVTQATVQLAVHLWRTADPAFTAISQSGEAYSPPAVPAQAAEVAKRYRELYSSRAVFA